MNSDVIRVKSNKTNILVGRNTMIFKCENMKRGYGALMIVLAELWFFVVLMTQDVSAYPYGINQNKWNAVHFPDMLSGSDANETQSDLDRLIEKTFENGEPSHLHGKLQRDTSRYQDGNMENISSDHHRGEAQERMQSETKFVFPGEIVQVPICKGSTYCENIASYPVDIVNEAIQRNESLKVLAGVDDLSDIVQRIDVTDDVPLCVSTEQVIYPQSAENKNNEWKYIANQDNFKQGIRVERCSKERHSCSIIGGLAEGYKTTCKQKYVYRQLASVQTDGKIVPDTFRFPSSCCCHVSFNGNTFARMGVNIVEQKSQITPIKTRKRK